MKLLYCIFALKRDKVLKFFLGGFCGICRNSVSLQIAKISHFFAEIPSAEVLFSRGWGAVDFYVFLWVERTRSFTASLNMTVDPKTHQKEFDLISFPFTGKKILFRMCQKEKLHLDYFHLFNVE